MQNIEDIKYADPFSLKTIESVTDEIELVLIHLTICASELTADDLRDHNVRMWYISRIDWLKRLYERMETITLSQ